MSASQLESIEDTSVKNIKNEKIENDYISEEEKESSHSKMVEEQLKKVIPKKVEPTDNTNLGNGNDSAYKAKADMKKSSFNDLSKPKIQLTWKNITISAPPKGKMCKKPDETEPDFIILDDLSGTVKPGQFLGIIGASGAGKTTFLNYLSGKDPSKNLKKKGQVLINGVDRSHVTYGKYVGYVQQDDVLMQTQTVRECLMFAARMKLPSDTNYEEKVDELLESLKLSKAADTKIGGPLLKGVSGGERKRTSIGVELISDPSMIFLDEPTTGLDSFTALNVVEVLRGLAESGRSVISTIHQPNSETFENFDQLLLMAQGHIIYQNTASIAVDHFTRIGYKCPERTNPADFFMNMMSIEAMDDVDDDDHEELVRSRTIIEESYKAKIIDLYEKYENSELRNDPDDVHPEVKELSTVKEKEHRANICKQFYYLFVRSMRNIIRLPISSYVKIISTIVVALMTILVFRQLGHNERSIQNRNGVVFFVLINFVLNSVTNVTLIFPDERPVFLREQSAEMYNPVPYFFAKFFSELPIMLINNILFFFIAYFALELNTESVKQPTIFFFYAWLLSWTGTGLGFMIGTLVSSKSVATSLIPVTVIPLMLLSGFFVNQDNIVPVLYPFEFISPFKWGFQVLAYNEYDDLSLD